MIVSYSEIFKYQTCPRQYYYRFSLNKAPIEESDAIQTGIKGHRLLQDFYELMRQGKTKEEALAIVTQTAMKLAQKPRFMGQAEQTDFALLKAWTLVSNYVGETDFTAESELIENRFLVPVSAIDSDPSLSHVQIGFTPDLVSKRTGGHLDVEDAKFVGRAWSQSKMNRFQQIKLYQIFLSRMGYASSRGILRFFNVQTGKITTKNYVLKGREEETIIRDFMVGVRDVVKFKSQEPELLKLAPRTMNYTACQFCHFEFVCTLEAEGKDASKTLDTMYKDSNYDYTR
jgi:hypothetical protein